MIWGRLVYLWLRMMLGRKKQYKIVAHNPAFDPSYALMQDYCVKDVEMTMALYDALPYSTARKYNKETQ